MKSQRTAVNIFGLDPIRIGAGEMFARELARQLDAQGWRCVFCYLSEPPEPVRRFLTLPNVTVEIIPEVHTLALRPTQAVARILRKYRPEVVHLSFTGFLSTYPWVAKLCGAAKVFFTDQHSRPEAFVARRTRLWKRLVGGFLNAPLTGVISVSQYACDCLRDGGVCSPDQFKVIYNSADLARADEGMRSAQAFRERYRIPQGRMMVTQVSTMIPEKGIPELLNAARLVIAGEPRAHFVFGGEGPFREQYIRMAEELGLAGSVTFTGLLQDPLKDGVFANADVVCQISQWEEAFGQVITEGMASRRPIVATRVGGIPEIVEHGVTGYLVERRDIRDIADRILQLLANPALREKMGDAGRRVADEKFNLEKNVAKFLELYGIPILESSRKTAAAFAS